MGVPVKKTPCIHGFVQISGRTMEYLLVRCQHRKLKIHLNLNFSKCSCSTPLSPRRCCSCSPWRSSAWWRRWRSGGWRSQTARKRWEGRPAKQNGLDKHKNKRIISSEAQHKEYSGNDHYTIGVEIQPDNPDDIPDDHPMLTSYYQKLQVDTEITREKA